MSFDGWLDARDSDSVLREWSTLGARHVQIGQWGPSTLQITPTGTAMLAAGFLGCSPERFAWFATDRNSDPVTWPPPTFTAHHMVDRSFVDHDFDLSEADCSEAWTIREVIEGARGVQHITIDCAWGEMTREGGNGRSASIVRVFDRSAKIAVSIPLYSTGVWMVGELDLTPLDLFSRYAAFKLTWPTYTLDSVRGLVAQLTADLDAHFDTSPTWTGGEIDEEVFERGGVRHGYRFESGARAIELDEYIAADTGWLSARVHGLPWGHQVRLRVDRTDDPVRGIEGWLDVRLPRAQLDAAFARLARIPGITLV